LQEWVFRFVSEFFLEPKITLLEIESASDWFEKQSQIVLKMHKSQIISPTPPGACASFPFRIFFKGHSDA